MDARGSGTKRESRPAAKRRSSSGSVPDHKSGGSPSSTGSPKESAKSRALDWDMEEVCRQLKKLEVVEEAVEQAVRGRLPETLAKGERSSDDASRKAGIKIKHNTHQRAGDYFSVDRSLVPTPD